MNRASIQVVATDDGLQLLDYRRGSNSTRRRSSTIKKEYIQLHPITKSTDYNEDNETDDGTDGGSSKDSKWGWVIVFASFMNNFVLDGVSFSYGVLASNIIAASKNEISEFDFHLCGSVMLGTTLVIGPIVSLLANRFGFRAVSVAGSLISALGFFISYFASPEVPDFYALLLGFGVLGGIGFGFMFITSIVIVGLYFDENSPLATGIAVTGSAVGSMLMPLFFEYVQTIWDWQGAMISLAICCLLSSAFGAMYRPLPTTHGDKKAILAGNVINTNIGKKNSDFSDLMELLMSPTFWLLSISGGITVLGYFVPSAFLKDRAEGAPFNATSNEATLLPMAIGASNTVGRVFYGLLANSERKSYSLLMTNVALTFGGLATIASAYATKYYQLLIYALIYGQMIAVYATLRSIIVKDIVGAEKLNLSFGVSLVFMGVALFFGNSVAGWLKDKTGDYELSFHVAGGLFVISAVICYPLLWIFEKEKARNEIHKRKMSLANRP